MRFCYLKEFDNKIDGIVMKIVMNKLFKLDGNFLYLFPINRLQINIYKNRYEIIKIYQIFAFLENNLIDKTITII